MFNTHLDTSEPGHSKPTETIEKTALETSSIQALLATDNIKNHHRSFKQAVQKQQQLFTICNTLERQKSLLLEIESLLNNKNGVLWLDAQISQFKNLCPSHLLMKLSRCTNTTNSIENCEIIHLNFLSLLNEIFYVPLNALSKLQIRQLDDQERKDWYEWCLNIDQQLLMFKIQIKSARSFFCTKSFDKICYLAKDSINEQQLGNIKYLFQHKVSSIEDTVHD